MNMVINPALKTTEKIKIKKSNRLYSDFIKRFYHLQRKRPIRLNT